MKTEKEIRKKIVEILADYGYNSTRTETTEQFADKIINLIQKQTFEQVEKEIDVYLNVTKENFECQTALKELKKSLEQLNKQGGQNVI